MEPIKKMIPKLVRKRNIWSKLFWSYFITMLLTVSFGGMVMSSVIRNAIERNINLELSNSTQTILNLVKSSANTSIKNHLRAVAEKNRDIVQYFYRRYIQMEFDEQTAKNMARDILLSQVIGSTGYIYCLDSSGTLRVHPNKALVGVNIAQNDFVQAQVAEQEGYLSYEWANPGEKQPRQKALYMVYFAPWDWIISVSSYREEFIQLINTRDVEESVSSLQFGTTGYAFIISGRGDFVVHPSYQGSNINDIQIIEGREQVQNIIRQKNGSTIYAWKNPGEEMPRKKLVVFSYIPELDWIVASSSYLDEFYKPLETINYTILTVIFAVLILAFFTSFFLGRSITDPLYQLINSFKFKSEGDFSHRIEVDSSGEIGELASQYNDFMKRLENYHHKLSVSEANFRGIFEGAVEGIFKSTAEGEIVSLNSSLAAMLGYADPDELIRLTEGRIEPFFVGERSSRQILWILQNKGHVSQYETRMYQKDRSVIWVSLSARGIMEQGLLTHVEGFINDISDRKRFQKELMQRQREIEEQNIVLAEQTEELKRLSAIKDDFLAMTTHELRTPLHGMIGLADSLIHDGSGELSDAVKGDLEIIVSSGRRLSNLVNDLLVAQKLKQKEIILHPRALDMGKMVDGVISIHRPMTKDSGIKFDNQVPENTYVNADEERLQQILHNLIGNSVKFSESGTISVSARSDDGGKVRVRVSDTGIGIEKDKLEAIFLPFEQGDYSATRPYQGTGLGLSITKQLVRLHGGEIWVESEPGSGSVFSFTLPESADPPASGSRTVAKTLDVIPAVNNALKRDAEAGRRDLPEIVVVDDDTANLHIVSRQLETSDFRTKTFASGGKAVEYIRENKPCMVLLDVMMPKMDGFQVCDVIRDTYSLDELPVIFLTARNQVTDLVQGFAMGGNDYLTKPFSQNELVSRVRTQYKLLTAKKRLANLRAFVNGIEEYKDTDRLFSEAFEFLLKERIFTGGALLSNGKIMARKGTDITIPGVSSNSSGSSDSSGSSESGTDDEVSVLSDDGRHWVRIRVNGVGSHEVVLEAGEPIPQESLDYVHNLVAQIKVVRSSITTFAFDPGLSKEIYTIGSMLSDIIYIQAAKQYCVVHTEDRKSVELRLSLKEITIRFNEDQLIQVHRSYLVNPLQVTSIKVAKNKRIDINIGQIKIPVGGSYRTTVLRAFPDHISEPTD